jgi:predicted nucleotidyltransferase
MKLGLVHAGFRDLMVERLKAFFQDREEVLAAYLFGSAIEDAGVVNDIDILLLPRAGDLDALLLLLTELDVCLAEHLGLVSTDQLDLIPFDLRLVEPVILYQAVNTGILLKCVDETALAEAIENLSRYFLENEGTLYRQRILNEEMFA